MVEAMEIPKGFKKTEVGIIPNDWDLKNIVENSTMKARIGWQGLTVAEYLNKGDYFLITGTDFVDGKIKWDTCHYVNKARYAQDKNIQVKIGDILITKDGTIGKVAYVDRLPLNATLNSGVFVIRPKGNIYLPLFLSYIFNSFYFRDFLNNLVAGSTIIHLYQKDFVSFSFPLPPTKAEQAAIAEALNDADALITELEKLIAKKKAIKQGAMQELLKPKAGWEVRLLGDFLDYEQPTKYVVADTEYNDHNQTPVLTAGKTFILGYTNEEFGVFNNHPVIIFDDFTTATKYIDFPFKVKSSAMKILKPKKDVNLRFVFELMQTIKFDSTDHKRYWISEYRNIEVKVPRPDEQDHISKILSDMDAEIEVLEKKLDKYKMLKQGLMQNLLTGKIRLI